MPENEPLATILVFVMAFGGTCLFEFIGLRYFRWFVSHERKEGRYRIEDLTRVNPTSTKLPAIGGIAAFLALTIALVTSYLLGFTEQTFRWFLLPVWSFGLIGFMDDVRKFRGQGQAERTRLALIVICSLIVGYVLYRSMEFNVPYPPYSSISYAALPLVWAIWWFVMSTGLTTVTTLSVGFSDGVDGLLGGLWLIASIAYAIFTTAHNAQIASDISVAMIGAALGFLLLNLPSRWSAGRPREERRARVYLGETGALMVGGAFSILALLTQTEFIWFLVGGVFVLEGVSAFVQAKIATPIFRRFLILAGHRDRRRDVPHTEFPLPFLATPLHAHFDLLGMDRLRIVRMMWLLGAAFALIGMSAAFASELFTKVIIWLLGLALMSAVWNWGMWTRSVFVGFYPELRGPDRCVAVFRGRPMEIFGRKLYWLEDRLPIKEADALRFGLLTNLVMYRAMTKDEARIALGYIFYRLERFGEAVEIWDSVRPKSIEIRDDIRELYAESRARLLPPPAGGDASDAAGALPAASPEALPGVPEAPGTSTALLEAARG